MQNHGEARADGFKTRKPQTNCQIHVFKIAKIAFIKAANSQKCCASIEAGRATGAEDLSIGNHIWPPLSLPSPPSQTSHMPDIPHPIEHLRVTQSPLDRSDRRHQGVNLRDLHHGPEPIRLDDRIGIEKHDEICRRSPDAQIIGRRKSAIIANLQD